MKRLKSRGAFDNNIRKGYYYIIIILRITGELTSLERRGAERNIEHRTRSKSKMALLTSDEGPMGNNIDVATATASATAALPTSCQSSVSSSANETTIPCGNHNESGLFNGDHTKLNGHHHVDDDDDNNVDDDEVHSVASNTTEPETNADAMTTSMVDGEREQQLDINRSATDVKQLAATKKTRLISVDSGFGSFGPSELNVVAISSEASTAHAYPARVSSAFDALPATGATKATSVTTTLADKPKTAPTAQTLSTIDADLHGEKDDKLSPLHKTGEQQPRRLSDGDTDHKQREYRKNRTTTLVTDEPNAELDVRLINRCDGLKDVMCYLDEDGCPQVREKHTKRKSTLKQELKSRQVNLGASLDADSMRGIQKKSNWVSFSRLCKKFKESFLSKCARSSYYILIIYLYVYGSVGIHDVIVAHQCTSEKERESFSLIVASYPNYRHLLK